MGDELFAGEQSDRLLLAIQGIARARVAVREHDVIDRGFVERELAAASHELIEIIRSMEGRKAS